MPIEFDSSQSDTVQMPVSSPSDQDQTVQMQVPPPGPTPTVQMSVPPSEAETQIVQPVAPPPAALPEDHGPVQAPPDETVRVSAPPPDAGSAPAGRGTQPTLKVDVKPISETQPTVPMMPMARVSDNKTAVLPGQPRPVTPAPPGGEPKPFIRRGVGIGPLPFSGWVLVGAAGIGILLILLAIGLLIASRPSWAASTPTPTATLTPMVAATLPRPPTAPPTPTQAPPTPTAAPPTNTPRPAPTALEAGVLAKVTPPAGLKLKVRGKAGTGGQVLGELEAGAQVKILEGPVTADNLKWWKVDNGQGLVGWSAEGVGGDVYLTPVGWAQ